MLTQSNRAQNSLFKVKMLKLHRWFAWLGFVAMLLWGGSGLLHSWLTLFGVQQAVFTPPQRQLDLLGALPFQKILSNAAIGQAVAVRVVVGEAENLLQVTEQQNKPRRYFNLKTGEELKNHDKVYAAFLARHYLNLPYAEIASVEFIGKFSNEYPAVNRLLPVYKVSFEGANGLHAWVYTETAALAGVSNSTKKNVQTARLCVL